MYLHRHETIMYLHRHSGTDGFALLSSIESSKEGVAEDVPLPCSHAAVDRRQYAPHGAIFEHPEAKTALQREEDDRGCSGNASAGC